MHGDDGSFGRDHVLFELDAAELTEGSPVEIDAAVVVDKGCGVDVLDVVGLGERLRDDGAGGMRVLPWAEWRIGDCNADDERVAMLALPFLHGSVEIKLVVWAFDDLTRVGVAGLRPGEDGFRAQNVW